VAALAQLAERTQRTIHFTFAPRTPLLALMIAVGRLFPRGNRAPWLEPMAAEKIAALMAAHPTLHGWQSGRTQRVSSGFYQSQALEWSRT
jgi:magnesium-protoporphyrin O-methyltransferase